MRIWVSLQINFYILENIFYSNSISSLMSKSESQDIEEWNWGGESQFNLQHYVGICIHCYIYWLLPKYLWYFFVSSYFFSPFSLILSYSRENTLCIWWMTYASICAALYVVQLLSCVWLFLTPWIVACQSPLSSTISQSLLKFLPIELVMLFNHLTLCHPLLLLPSIFPSIRVFCNESVFASGGQSIGASASAPVSGSISFKIDGFDLLAVQGTLKSLLQHHNLKASILWHSASFVVQVSHLYMTTGKTIALTRG